MLDWGGYSGSQQLLELWVIVLGICHRQQANLFFFFLLVTVGVSCLKPDVAALLGKSLNPALDAARKLVALHSESLQQAEEIPFQLPWKCEFTKK